MRSVVLVKHSLPEVIAGVPAREWRLSAEGRRRCEPLATALASYEPAHILASEEPKAADTARLVGDRLRVGVQVVAGLHEHDRSNAGWLDSEAFERAVTAFFQRPGELVLGRETAAAAEARFAAAVDGILASTPRGNVVVVAHGTVIALWAAARTGMDPLSLWQRLECPSYVVVRVPGYELADVVGRVAE